MVCLCLLVKRRPRDPFPFIQKAIIHLMMRNASSQRDLLGYLFQTYVSYLLFFSLTPGEEVSVEVEEDEQRANGANVSVDKKNMWFDVTLSSPEGTS